MPCSWTPTTVRPEATNLAAEWDDDMTYLYVDYPYYKKYMIFATISAVRYSNILPNIVPLPL